MSFITRQSYIANHEFVDSKQLQLADSPSANPKKEGALGRGFRCKKPLAGISETGISGLATVFQSRTKGLSSNHKNVADCLTAAALNRGLYFRYKKPLAVISGAGIAGLAAAFKLRARGFGVVIPEMRTKFSRENIINLNVETQVFLKEFGLLEEFEKLVAARIKEHKYVVMDKTKTAQKLDVSDVSALELDKSVSFTPEKFSELFKKDGIYSVSIGLLQTFLANHALEMGVNILGNARVTVLSRSKSGGIAKVQLAGDRVLSPDLFFIAEGAHSSTARVLGIEKKKIEHACTDENWIFGNMAYNGAETFVVSIIDTSEKALQIANVIFNAKAKAINIAVNSDRTCSTDEIQQKIRKTAQTVFDQKAFPLENMGGDLLTTVAKPVHVLNQIAHPFSKGNVFCIGDAAGCSSPLAGLGGTLGLTLVPATVSQLLDDYETQPDRIHENFHTFSSSYTGRWMEKSDSVKTLCLGIFHKEQSKTLGSE